MASRETLEIIPDEYFYPFKGFTRLRPVKPVDLMYDYSYVEVLVRRVKLLGIPGKYTASTAGNALEEVCDPDRITPLGPVSIEAVNNNGKIQIINYPLYVLGNFFPQNRQQTACLEEYIQETVSGDYCEYSAYRIGDRIVSRGYYETELVLAVDVHGREAKGDIYPSDISTLAQIKMRFIKDTSAPREVIETLNKY